MNLGFNIENATERAREYAAKRTVWSKAYWVNKGYSEEEAYLKCLEYNGMSALCKKYKGSMTAFYEKMEAFSNDCKDRFVKYRDALYQIKDNDTKIKTISIGHGVISKAERLCFECLLKINPKIEHKPYIVAFPPDFISLQNKVCYICDGFLKIDDTHYIVIEYDGAIGRFHDPDVDILRSEEILMADNAVIGVLRIQETLFKNYKRLAAENGLNNIIKSAITNITLGKEQIIVLN